ncbi:helix-turn-helix domain containing protein [Anaerostipes hadrus]|nr:helix-turn-helix domain containing protein [Anaerostipes hadrus]
MAVTDKIKALLSIKGKKNVELAAYLGISPQSLQNKFTRGSFSAEDLIKVSDFLGCTLAFEIDDSQKIILETSDIRD